MDLNITKTNALYFTVSNSINFNCHIAEVSILCTDYMQYLSAVMDSEVCFH
jgi:hypothetical protein